jgi:predicted Ser/Thr protein kinase
MAGTDVGALHLSDAERALLASCVHDFEHGWNEGQLAARVRKLPAPGSPVRRAALVELVKMDMQQRWQAGRRVLLDAYLKGYPELGTADTVSAELILAEWQIRRKFGSSSAQPAEYARRFPRQADELQRRMGEVPPLAPASSAAGPSRETRSLRASTRATGGRTTPAALPEQFGRYKILKQLGQGGMGSVFLAQDSQLDRQVALKVPHFSADDGPEVLERFAREARAAAALEHPNICPVYDVGEIDGTPYVTMAYVEGRTLAELIEGGKALPPRPAAAVVRKLAAALHQAHRHGIIHRDLKPSNVLVNQRNEPVVMDFGLARRIGKDDVRVTKSGSILGTPAYMSPEQVSGDALAVGPASDIYSLGVILYEMLTGQLPFQGPTAAVLGQIMTQEPAPPRTLRADIDPPLEAICLKAMAKKPGDRFRSMEELANALAQYLKGHADGAQALAAGAAPGAVVLGAVAGGASGAAGEGLATQLLARLVDRLELPSQPAAPAPEPADKKKGHSGWVAAVVALMVVVVCLAIAAMFKPQPKMETNVHTNVVVRLDGLKAILADPDVVGLRLNKKPITKEELAEKVEVPTGENDLEVTRKDGSVEHLTFDVAEGDKDKAVLVKVKKDKGKNGNKDKALVKRDPKDGKLKRDRPKRVVVAPDKVPGHDELPFEANWHIGPLRKDFVVQKIQHDAVARTLTWHVQTKRGFNNVSDVIRHSVLFYDAAGARIHDARLSFTPNAKVKKGQALRISFGCPAEAVSRLTKCVLVQRPEDKVFPAGVAPALEASNGKPAGKAAWDLKPLRKYFHILRVNYDEDVKYVRWLVQAKRSFNDVAYAIGLYVRFYDGADARVDNSAIYYHPNYGVLKGERIYITVNLPTESVRQQVKRVLLLTALDKEFTSHPGPKFKVIDGKPKGKIAWDLERLQKYFDFLAVSYDADKKYVKWLVQAKRGFNDAAYAIGLHARFYDGADARVDSSGLNYYPNYGVLKGERIYITVNLPTESVRQQVKRVLLLTALDKEFTSHTGPKFKPIKGQPDGTIAWDLEPLRKYFDFLAVSYDADKKYVKWLVQAKRGFNDIGYALGLKAHFYDAEGTRVDRSGINYYPNYDVRKGERFYITVNLPVEALRVKTKKVRIEK